MLEGTSAGGWETDLLRSTVDEGIRSQCLNEPQAREVEIEHAQPHDLAASVVQWASSNMSGRGT
jgi:hypothetical protein